MYLLNGFQILHFWIRFATPLLQLKDNCCWFSGGGERDLQSVSHWGLHCCRLWRGWTNRPRCTRARCRSACCCWWTACRCYWCSRRSCSCPSLGHHSPKPTQRWSPVLRGPRIREKNHTVSQKRWHLCSCKPNLILLRCWEPDASAVLPSLKRENYRWQYYKTTG